MENKVNLPIYLSRPNLDDEDINSVIEVLKSGNLVQGKNVLELESKISSYLGQQFCSAVSNGTASLHLALLAVGVKPGDEVIIPALSYIATANAIELVGAIPIFVDIDIRTFNIDVSQIENKISRKTKCIMPVHEFGLCANMDVICELAEKYNLAIVEDAACAIGATFNGKFAGTFGDFGSFSLHPRKSITCGEGGLLITSSEKLDLMIKTLRNHGIKPNTYPMDFVQAGFNYRLTDFQAALVSSQMKRLNSIIARKTELVEIYYNTLRKDIITLPFVPASCRHSWQTFHLVIENNKTRDSLNSYLKENQIFCNYGAQCIPEMTFYKNKYNLDTTLDFPNALRAYDSGLAIPLGETSTEEELNYVCEIINKF